MALLFPCKKAGGIGLASLVITTPPTKTTYAQYDTLDLTGLKVTATFKDGLVADVTDLCQITPADGSELSDYGNIDITIKYANKTVTQSITVNQMTAIAVTTQPTKTRYLVGENLDLTGIAVTATAGALTRDVTSLAEYDPPNGTQLNTQGTQRVDVDYADVSTYFDVEVAIRSILKKLPHAYFYNGRAVVLDGEIHILGNGNDYNYQTRHYKWNGSSWVSVSTLPYNFTYGQAVVYNNEIHILGGYSSSYGTKHYKWNGSSWVSVSTLPYRFYEGSAAVYNNEIHILGGYDEDRSQTKHYKWNGSSWVSVSTLPYKCARGRAVVFDGEIHILGSDSDNYNNYQTRHYKWNGSSWVSVSTLPYKFANGGAVVLDGEIHILSSESSSNGTKHYKWNGSSWVSVSTLPYEIGNGGAVVWNSGANNEIVILCGSANVEQWDGTSWTVGTD